MNVPTLAGFLLFVRNQMGIPAAVLPDDSVYLAWAYGAALEMVNVAIQAASPLTYMLAVYNLAASNLVNFAEDVPQVPPVAQGFFTALRAKLGIGGLAAGLVSSASDEGTSGSLAVPDFVKNMSLADLQYFQNPWGRQYLAFAQRYGTVWGLN